MNGSFEESSLDGGGMGDSYQYRVSPSMPPVAESPTAHSSSSESPARFPVPASPLAVRGNFGKGGGYVPPKTGGGRNGGLFDDEPVERHMMSTIPAQHVPAQRAIQLGRITSSESKPFDERVVRDEIPEVARMGGNESAGSRAVLADHDRRLNVSEESTLAVTAPVSETRNLTDWERSPPRNNGGVNTSHRDYYSDNQHDNAASRFRMPPPRLSEPRNEEAGGFETDDSRDLSAQAHLSGKSPPRNARGANADYEEFGTGGSVTAEESAVSTPLFPGEVVDADEDNDSLFEFEEEERRRGQAAAVRVSSSKNRRSRRQSEHADDEGDDTSLEQDYGAVIPHSSLQERAQAAWKRKPAVMRSTSPDAASKEAQSVSFGKGNTVHHFEPDIETRTVGTVDTETKSLSQRSLNSEYTKSAESEVEDVLKDIFMIGKPEATKVGRRKVKYNSEVANQRSAEVVPAADTNEFEDEDTLDPSAIGEERPRRSSRRGRGRSTSRRLKSMDVIDEKKEEDPLLGVWNYMEGGITAVSNAFGLESASGDSGDLSRISERSRSMNQQQSNSTGGLQSLMEYYSDFLGGSASTESGPCESATKEPEPEVVLEAVQEEILSPPSLEEDMRLVDLALQAARSAHRLQGYEFDETYDVNIVTDIKFSVVDLELPLGLIFQENDGGCWVTKVLPDGTAKKSGSVVIGDQLAAIDGVSAIRMTVDEIARTIKRKKAVIELTFLRYVGPLKPAAGDIEEEGYEVKASAMIGERQRRAKEAARAQSRTEAAVASESKGTRKQQSKSKAASPKQSQQVGSSATEKKKFRWRFGRKKAVNNE